MAHAVPNTNPATNATFTSWLADTVQMGQLLSGNVVTTAANSAGEGTSGNGYINGTFSVDVLVANAALRGGTVTTPNVLPISSNVVVTGNTITIGNTVINSTAIVTGTLIGNVTVTGISFGNSTVNAVGNSTVYELNTPTSSFFVNSSTFSVGNVSANAGTITIGTATINSTIYTGEAQNANLFGGQPPSYYIEAAGSSNNSLFLGGLPASAYAVLATNNAFTGNNTFGGTNTVITSNVVAANVVANNLTSNIVYANTYNGNNAVLNGSVTANGLVQGATLQTAHAIIATNTSVVNTTAQVVIDSFPKTLCQCAKYLIFVYNTGTPTLVHSIEVMMINDGNNSVIQTQYAELFNGSGLGTFDASINSANVQVLFTATSANSSNTLTVKLVRTQVI